MLEQLILCLSPFGCFLSLSKVRFPKKADSFLPVSYFKTGFRQEQSEFCKIKQEIKQSSLFLNRQTGENSSAKRENLQAKANQQETTYSAKSRRTIDRFFSRASQNEALLQQFGSSETTREASSFSSFQFFDYYQHFPQHGNKKKCSPEFLTWLIGFFEAEVYFDTQLISSRKTKRVFFEVTQNDPKILYKIRQTLGFGIVYTIKKKNEKMYYRYFTSKREHVLRLIQLLNGNLVLKKRQLQFEKLISEVNDIWECDIQLQPWTAQPSLLNAWISGFVEGDGGFYINPRNFTEEKKYTDYHIRYNRILLKFYVTQKGEFEILKQIRDLFQATNKIYKIRNNTTNEYYNRLEIFHKKSRNLLLKYFKQFPLQGEKHIDFLRWQRVHNYKEEMLLGKQLSEKSVKKLQRLFLQLKKKKKENQSE
nr:hypothetical protein [Trochiscia hystrix]